MLIESATPDALIVIGHSFSRTHFSSAPETHSPLKSPLTIVLRMHLRIKLAIGIMTYESDTGTRLWRIFLVTNYKNDVSIGPFVIRADHHRKCHVDVPDDVINGLVSVLGALDLELKRRGEVLCEPPSHVIVGTALHGRAILRCIDAFPNFSNPLIITVH